MKNWFIVVGCLCLLYLPGTAWARKGELKAYRAKDGEIYFIREGGSGKTSAYKTVTYTDKQTVYKSKRRTVTVTTTVKRQYDKNGNLIEK